MLKQFFCKHRGISYEQEGSFYSLRISDVWCDDCGKALPLEVGIRRKHESIARRNKFKVGR